MTKNAKSRMPIECKNANFEFLVLLFFFLNFSKIRKQQGFSEFSLRKEKQQKKLKCRKKSSTSSPSIVFDFKFD